MKLANNATIVVLATFPHFCAGQGSIRVSSKPPPFLNDAEVQAMASLDSLFEKLPDSYNRRLSSESEKQLGKKLREKLLTDVQEKLDVVKADSKGYEIDEDKYGSAVDAIDSVIDSIKRIKSCSSGECDSDKVAGVVFSVLGTVGMVVGLAFPPLGAVIAAVASIGALIASFFGSAPINPMKGLDAAAIEGAAFKAVQRVEDTGTFAGLADFTKTLRLANQFNSDLNNKMDKCEKGRCDHIIEAWFDQYHSYKWGNIVSRMKDVGEDYFSAYGNVAGSRRGAFNDWVKNSKKTCTIEHYLKKGQQGRDNLNKCKENMSVAKTNYDYVEMFGRHFISLANSLTVYSMIVESILSKHSTCNGENGTLGDFTCDYYISHSALKFEINDSIMERASTLMNTIIGKDGDGGLTQTCEEPVSNMALWPWNQKCGIYGTRCNYKYLLITSQTDQESIVNECEGDGCKLLIKEMNVRHIMINRCEHQSKLVSYNKDEKTFYGGIYGWNGSTIPDLVMPINCKLAVDNTERSTYHDLSMIAIPGYSLEIPDCVALFEDSQNFGIKEEVAAAVVPTCTKDYYSIKTTWGGDYACWEEEISLCDIKKLLDNPKPSKDDVMLAAKELMSHHKAAKELGWSRSFYNGEGRWNEKVNLDRCEERGFGSGEKVKCNGWKFNWDIKACMYD